MPIIPTLVHSGNLEIRRLLNLNFYLHFFLLDLRDPSSLRAAFYGFPALVSMGTACSCQASVDTCWPCHFYCFSEPLLIYWISCGLEKPWLLKKMHSTDPIECARGWGQTWTPQNLDLFYWPVTLELISFQNCFYIEHREAFV